MSDEKLIGVNLGGWLILEKWISPSLFMSTKAEDEYSLSEELGSQAHHALNQHYESFITKEDFKWIASNGLNAVRIPVGYWIFGDEPPFVGNIEYLDFAMEQCAKNNIRVIIDLHGAPGSQNSWQHSGRQGKIRWSKKANISKSLQVIERIAERYNGAPNFYGIELINEPHWRISQKKLLDYYQRGYEIIRDKCGHSVVVIFSDAFQPKKWINAFPSEFENILLDMHLYQVFLAKDKKLSVKEHIDKASGEWSQLIERIQSDVPVIIGEWSMALDQRTVGLGKKSQVDYGLNQLKVFSKAVGWLYWTYKTENPSHWNFRYCVENDWLKLA